MTESKLAEAAKVVVDIFLNETRELSPDALKAMARKAMESEHAGERDAFSKKLRSMGHDPEEIVKSSGSRHREYGGEQRGTESPPHKESVPTWAWAGHSGGNPPSHNIYNQSYNDINFIKKKMWDLSNQSKEEHTIRQFDGSFFRNIYTAYGHESIYPEMAKAMLHWGGVASPYHTKAVFASTGNNKKIRLIWANGQHVSPHVEIQHFSFNQSPSNDQHFMRGLSAWINKQVPLK